MINLFEAIRANPVFKTFEVGEVLFAKYTCPLQERLVPVWSQYDHLVHVLSGEKTWSTATGSWPVGVGDTLFFKKGAYILEQEFSEDFCVLAFFLPDEFVRQIVREIAADLGPTRRPCAESQSMAISVRMEPSIEGFLHSMATYFAADETPSEALLRVKLRELVTSILVSRRNPALSAYFRLLASESFPRLPAIMEANFCRNLPLEAFARMSHRSLSSFKREFQRYYGIPPARWLLHRRPERAAGLLRGTGMSVTEVALDCGFESLPHFSRAFKRIFSRSPRDFRDLGSEANFSGKIVDG